MNGKKASLLKKTIFFIFVIVLANWIVSFSQNADADPAFKSLIIQGDSVNVRVEADVKSPVVKKMKLMDICDVLNKGKGETVSGKSDYWYKIRFVDSGSRKTGWVFGAFTSLRFAGRKKMIMVFEGCTNDSNTFEHRIFRDQKGKKWDFYGTENNFSDCELCAASPDGSGTSVGIKKYLGKRFEVVMNDLMFTDSCLGPPEECGKPEPCSRPSVIYLRPIE